ncbi:uncharacterized protein (DUF58 family) [Neisseria sp. HSC-16F19]|nr:DUF58 domain-containing protein [Neisseria sp. HSC-16F19]MCP2041725.1 uncharacterized protein (DUF58 family) [Neisseria sp. HSC-16F19]
MWPWPKTPEALAADGSRGLSWSLIRSHPTRLGWGILLACLLLWVMAVNYQVNVAYILVFWLFGVLLAGVLMCWRQLLGLSLQAEVAGECFAGEPVPLHLRAGGRGRQRRWLWLFLGHGNDDEHGHWQPWTVHSADTDAAALEWLLPPQPRGYLQVPLLRCISTAPFGVIMAESLWQYNGEAVVYPAPLPHALPQLSHGDETERHRRTLASGEDIAYLQEHQPGASLQQVAWKQYAKTGQLLDKRFEEGSVTVDQDWISYRDYPPHTPREQLAGYLCYRVLQAEQQRRVYTLELPHQTIAPGNGQRTQCLTALGLW